MDCPASLVNNPLPLVVPLHFLCNSVSDWNRLAVSIKIIVQNLHEKLVLSKVIKMIHL